MNVHTPVSRLASVGSSESAGAAWPHALVMCALMVWVMAPALAHAQTPEEAPESIEAEALEEEGSLEVVSPEEEDEAETPVTPSSSPAGGSGVTTSAPVLPPATPPAVERPVSAPPATTTTPTPTPAVTPTPVEEEDAITPVAEEASKQPPRASDAPIESKFTFASYGRVRAATDLDGGRPERTNVISHGSRIDEYNYAELEFQQLFLREREARKRFYAQVVATLAMGDDLFHFTGDFDQSMAVRNLYADAGWRLQDWTVSFWGGSRMYRGDDVYLLDFWPLDNLNTVGGGARVSYDLDGIGRTELKLHSGTSRLNDPFQLQVVQVPAFGFGTSDVIFLNRQRTISSARLQQDLWLTTKEDGAPTSGAKLVLYGEDHRLPQGTRRLEDGQTVESVPAESGRKLGAELGVWQGQGFFKGSFANLFFVSASDLAAYGEFGIPTGLNVNETSAGAKSRMFALSADMETPYAGLLIGSYYKYFRDADRDAVDFDDYWESTLAARGHVYLTEHIHPGFEYSYQVRRPSGPFSGTNTYEVPTVSKVSFIQALRLKKGMYSRPELRFIYTRSQLNRSAVDLFPTEDPRRQLADANGALTTHYLGVMVEWWFNNASLFRP